VAVLGAGAWGTVVSLMLARRGTPATLVCRTADQAAELGRTRRDERALREAELPDAVRVTWLGDPDALRGATLVAAAAPSRAVPELAGWLAGRHLPEGIGIVSLAKGLGPGGERRLSEVWAEHLPASPVCALSGPNHAEEVARGAPTAAVVAGDRALGERVRDALAGPRFRVYLNPDLVGVELCGAAKNVIALAAGMSDGLGLGDNAKASLITRGLAEMTRLGLAHGARVATYQGLAGMGDLVATCTSRHSRNRRAGEMIAAGVPAADVESRLGQVAEGLATARGLLAQADRVGVELPISEQVVAAAFGGTPVSACLEALMARAPAEEG
jgi:glycerol-3-phosphate dehydrogenase (NAD(P)+)